VQGTDLAQAGHPALVYLRARCAGCIRIDPHWTDSQIEAVREIALKRGDSGMAATLTCELRMRQFLRDKADRAEERRARKRAEAWERWQERELAFTAARARRELLRPSVGDVHPWPCQKCGGTNDVRVVGMFPHYRLCERCRAGRAEGEPAHPPRAPATSEPAVMQVHWEVLPPGEWLIGSRGDEILGQGDERAEGELRERLALLDRLHPVRWWRGIPLKGGREYLIAQFANCVVAECPLFGNALYIYSIGSGDDNATWQRVFQHTKREALELGARRITHRGDWQTRLRDAVAGTEARG
jgi:hypothetical protein